MPLVTTRAATRTGTARSRQPDGALLRVGQVVGSVESGLSYRIGALLGQGGFGQVFHAKRMGASDKVPDTLCIKVSSRQDGWLREAYFGTLLYDQPRAVRLYDAFPFFGAEGLLYGLALEYACHGDLSAFLAQGTKRWSEAAVRREIAGILHVLRKLHRGQLLHRDLTPLNVFVCEGHRLKLGDFGIVRQQSDHRGVTARTMNPHMAPSDLLDRAAPKWQARDDVYQVGQLIGMLLKGDPERRVRTPEVRSFTCSDHLKEIVYRCIGERRKRYESADELIRALEQPPPSITARTVKTLKGARVAFTGTLGVPRVEAAKAARRAGATVLTGASAKVTVIVRGRPNPLQAAGKDGGRKLLEIKRLREKGVRIALLSEAQFWRLAAPPKR